ncbi:hypothetical protein Fcan01_14315 [Folsomia candida]|uniref:Uncharacterized protein n=1 Tax=Folsomia candida TaxID=158441 RepID=A0A226E2J3_FOLCA|nr:hypothetical protein Fcan01_14315 [Folsomia candida]
MGRRSVLQGIWKKLSFSSTENDTDFVFTGGSNADEFEMSGTTYRDKDLDNSSGSDFSIPRPKLKIINPPLNITPQIKIKPNPGKRRAPSPPKLKNVSIPIPPPLPPPQLLLSPPPPPIPPPPPRVIRSGNTRETIFTRQAIISSSSREYNSIRNPTLSSSSESSPCDEGFSTDSLLSPKTEKVKNSDNYSPQFSGNNKSKTKNRRHYRSKKSGSKTGPKITTEDVMISDKMSKNQDEDNNDTEFELDPLEERDDYDDWNRKNSAGILNNDTRKCRKYSLWRSNHSSSSSTSSPMTTSTSASSECGSSSTDREINYPGSKKSTIFWSPRENKSFATVKRGLSLSRSNASLAASLINMQPLKTSDHDDPLKTSPVLHSFRARSLPQVHPDFDSDDDDSTSGCENPPTSLRRRSQRRLTFDPNTPTIFPPMSSSSTTRRCRRVNRNRFSTDWETLKKRSSSLTLNFGSNFSLSKYFQNPEGKVRNRKTEKCTCGNSSSSTSGFCDEEDDEENYFPPPRSKPWWWTSSSNLLKSFRLKKNKIAASETKLEVGPEVKKNRNFFASFSGTVSTKRKSKQAKDFKEVTLDLKSGMLKGTRDGKVICVLGGDDKLIPDKVKVKGRSKSRSKSGRDCDIDKNEGKQTSAKNGRKVGSIKNFNGLTSDNDGGDKCDKRDDEDEDKHGSIRPQCVKMEKKGSAEELRRRPTSTSLPVANRNSGSSTSSGEIGGGGSSGSRNSFLGRISNKDGGGWRRRGSKHSTSGGDSNNRDSFNVDGVGGQVYENVQPSITSWYQIVPRLFRVSNKTSYVCLNGVITYSPRFALQLSSPLSSSSRESQGAKLLNEVGQMAGHHIKKRVEHNKRY